MYINTRYDWQSGNGALEGKLKSEIASSVSVERIHVGELRALGSHLGSGPVEITMMTCGDPSPETYFQKMAHVSSSYAPVILSPILNLEHHSKSQATCSSFFSLPLELSSLHIDAITSNHPVTRSLSIFSSVELSPHFLVSSNHP